VGGPVSELNLRRLLEEDDFPDTIINFASRNSRGQQLKSSSLAIRDDKGKIIGALCLHFDISQFEQFHQFLEHLISSNVPSYLGINDFGESQPHDEEIKNEINDWLLKNSLLASQLTYKDKRAIVQHLSHRGCFKKKGAIPCVAQALQLTRQSIYNYLDLSKKTKDSYE
jgi:predicted transcriptional regulator YheO